MFINLTKLPKVRIVINMDMPHKTEKKTEIFFIVWMFILMLLKYRINIKLGSNLNGIGRLLWSPNIEIV